MKNETQDATAPVALMSFNPLINYTNFGRSRIYVLIEDEGFPPPLKIGKSCRWVKAEVDAWIELRKGARDGHSASAVAITSAKLVGGKNVR